MIRNETYFDSYRIEAFLLNALGSNPSLKARKELKGFYQWLVSYENGNTYICTPSEYRKGIESLLGYFGDAIDRLSKKKPLVAENARRLKESMAYIGSSEGILSL